MPRFVSSYNHIRWAGYDYFGKNIQHQIILDHYNFLRGITVFNIPIRQLVTVIATLLLVPNLTAAAPIDDARNLERQLRFGEAAAIYQSLVAKKPESIRLRLELADMLAKDRQWDAAVAQYRLVLKQDPGNVEAQRNLAQVLRWSGQIEEAIATYLEAIKRNPDSVDSMLGLAKSYELDHDFGSAQKILDQANGKWPKDKSVNKARYDFARQRNPRLMLFYEDDLSFRSTELGVYLPFSSREEVGVEYQTEERPGIYTRTDQKVLYKHYFGSDHSIDARYRSSSFSYTGMSVFASIGSFQEYRVRYIYPWRPNQVMAVRYTMRPTTLVGGETFTSHKVEAELRSRWSGKTETTVGTGWLNDLNEAESIAISDVVMATNTLVKLGFQYHVNHRLSLGGKYITNPDLDNTVNATVLLEAGYSLSGSYSSLYRFRNDDYKTGNDSSSLYAGLRYSPGSHLWSEGGIKYVTRGASSGFYPLVSLVYKF